MTARIEDIMSISYQTDQGIARLTFDRPAKKNAITGEMYEQFVAHLKQASADPQVRAVLISGAGGTFTAGNDLKDFSNPKFAQADSPVLSFMQGLAAFEKPAIAAVQGMAIGSGVTMLLHCDLVYVADDATLSMPFTSLGLVHLCRFQIEFADAHVQQTPSGTRLTLVIAAGRCEGERLRGDFLPGGGDWVLFGADRVARLDVRAVLRTDDGALVSVTNTGRARLDEGAVQRFTAGELLRADEVYARSSPLFETSIAPVPSKLSQKYTGCSSWSYSAAGE